MGKINYNEYELEIIDVLHRIITETIKLGFEYGSRDAKKVDFLHAKMVELLYNYIDTDIYDIIQEGKVRGIILDKDCDIVIVNKKKFKTNNGLPLEIVQKQGKGGKTVIIDGVEEVISVKNPISSYLKNANNYTEGVIGEAFNLKEVGIRYTHFMFISDTLPIYKMTKNQDGTTSRELIGKDEIGKNEIANFKKIKELSVIDDFVTFLYTIDRYEEDFEFSSDLVGEDPGITLYVDDIESIRYTFFFFEYLNQFLIRYGKM